MSSYSGNCVWWVHFVGITLLRENLNEPQAEDLLPNMQEIQKQFQELQTTFAAYRDTSPSAPAPTNEEIIDALLPSLLQSIRLDTEQILQTEMDNAEQKLRQSERHLLNNLMPRVNLTVQATEAMTSWATNQLKTGGG